MKRLLRAFWLLPSTRWFIREARQTPGFGLIDFIHGYVYARWPYLYIRIGTGEHPLVRILKPVFSFLVRALSHFPVDKPQIASTGLVPGKIAAQASSRRVTFADTYHGKVISLEAARKLVTVNQEIRLTDLEQVIPYSLARNLILAHPDHILVLECPCRASRPNPCRPLDVCLIIGEPFAGFAAEHYPDRCRWITPTAAVAILQAEDDRGHVHHAFFKEALLGRFFAICNCCSCCCGALQAHRNGIPMLASAGYVCRVNTARCIGCGTCPPACQFEALSLKNGVAHVDDSLCMGCGLCRSRCPEEALWLVRDPTKSKPLEIEALLAAATGRQSRKHPMRGAASENQTSLNGKWSNS
ncbi:MAG: 4Fe-4S binding protein [Desulfobacterales bacterium]|nr:MAG: 4Fe-4S binding protein [Desulfobacterales bacterium]